jgi:hypothetical protein
VPKNYRDYIEDVTEDIKICIEDMKCQPILFIGSGISKRYFGGPNWEELLKEMANNCPLIDKEFAYYKQIAKREAKDIVFPHIGKIFADCYREWAWEQGRNSFPQNLFMDDTPHEVYLKHKVSEYLESILPESIESIEDLELRNEIESLRGICPHALVTTNYDCFLELLFPEYEPIIGQQILRSTYTNFGEIFKIHGCTSEPNSIVLTEDDYKEFAKKKKYLSAKLLIYFLEHPLLFMGYSAEDPDIKSILSDVDEIIMTEDGKISNIYILEWKDDISDQVYPSREKIISVADQKRVIIKNVTTSSFKWVFDAFGITCPIENVSTKVLRSLLSRTYELVRSDIPRKKIEVDYDTLEKASSSQDELAKLYGITFLDKPVYFNEAFPYTITAIAEQLGEKHWSYVNNFIQKIIDDKGIDIKATDNCYHYKVKTGAKSTTHKYSKEAVNLLRKVKNGETYTLECQ